LTDTDFDVAIIGAGPAGLFAAVEIVRSRKDISVALLDAGSNLDARRNLTDSDRPANPWAGFGGAGFFIGGRLAVGGNSLSSVPVNADPDTGEALVAHVLDMLAQWEAGGTDVAGPPPALAEVAARAEAVGLQWHSNYPARHLSADERLLALESVATELATAGTHVATSTSITEMHRRGGRWELLAAEGQTINARLVMLAPGRNGAAWLAKQLNAVGVPVRARVSVGVRVEVLSGVMAPLTDLTPDPRVSINTVAGRFRTYACAKGAYVTVTESEGVRRVSLRPGGANPSPNTSFSVLWEPVGSPHLDLDMPAAVTRLECGFNDLKGGLGGLSPLSTGELPIAEHRPSWPDEYWDGFQELMRRMDRLVRGVWSASTLIHSPAVEQYWEYDIQSDGASSAPGLFLAGDGAGVSQGAMAAAISGILAASGVLRAL
jgi:uncharacterized FAD-dependent dehydrogenase